MTPFRPIRFPSPTVVALVAAVALLLLAGSARAQIRRTPRLTQAEVEALVPDRNDLVGVQVPADIIQLIDQLASESFDERELAMQTLLERRVERMHLYAMLYRDALSTEQRFRLLEVLRHRLIHEPRGAVGISMRARQLGNGLPIEIIVSDLVAGLPAERVLQVQDRIYEVDGHVLMTQDDLVRRVQAKLPGDTVRLALRRAVRDEVGVLVMGEDDRPVYQEMEIEMTLGSVDDLQRQGSNDVFQSSLSVRRQAEVSLAAERFSPVPAKIEVRAGFAGSVASNIDLSSPETHSAIQQVRNLLRSIEAGHIQVTPRLRGQWARQLEILREQSRDPSFTRTEQAYLRSVADQFQQLTVGR